MPFTDKDYFCTPEEGSKLFYSLLKEIGLQIFDEENNPQIKLLATPQGQLSHPPFFFLDPIILPDDESSKELFTKLVSLFKNTQHCNILVRFNFKHDDPELCLIETKDENVIIFFLKPFLGNNIEKIPLDQKEETISELIKNVLGNFQKTTLRENSAFSAITPIERKIKKRKLPSSEPILSGSTLVDNFYRHGYIAHIAVRLVSLFLKKDDPYPIKINFTHHSLQRQSDLNLVKKFYPDFNHEQKANQEELPYYSLTQNKIIDYKAVQTSNTGDKKQASNQEGLLKRIAPEKEKKNKEQNNQLFLINPLLARFKFSYKDIMFICKDNTELAEVVHNDLIKNIEALRSILKFDHTFRKGHIVDILYNSYPKTTEVIQALKDAMPEFENLRKHFYGGYIANILHNDPNILKTIEVLTKIEVINGLEDILEIFRSEGAEVIANTLSKFIPNSSEAILAFTKKEFIQNLEILTRPLKQGGLGFFKQDIISILCMAGNEATKLIKVLTEKESIEKLKITRQKLSAENIIYIIEYLHEKNIYSVEEGIVNLMNKKGKELDSLRNILKSSDKNKLMEEFAEREQVAKVLLRLSDSSKATSEHDEPLFDQRKQASKQKPGPSNRQPFISQSPKAPDIIQINQQNKGTNLWQIDQVKSALNKLGFQDSEITTIVNIENFPNSEISTKETLELALDQCINLDNNQKKVIIFKVKSDEANFPKEDGDLNQSNHYVGLHIIKKENGEFAVHYIDSTGRKINKEIKKIIDERLEDPEITSSFDSLQQVEEIEQGAEKTIAVKGTNCGPFLAYLLKQYDDELKNITQSRKTIKLNQEESDKLGITIRELLEDQTKQAVDIKELNEIVYTTTDRTSAIKRPSSSLDPKDSALLSKKINANQFFEYD